MYDIYIYILIYDEFFFGGIGLQPALKLIDGFKPVPAPQNVYSLKLGETVSQVGIEQKHKKTLEEN